MKKNTLSIFAMLTCSILFNGCVAEKKYADSSVISWNEFGDEELLQGTEMNFGDVITRPMRLLSADSILFLLNNDTENMIQLLNMNTSKEIGKYVSFGSGPEEMMTPRYIYKKDSIITIYDLNLRRLNKYVLNEKNELAFRKSTQFKHAFDDVFMLSDSVLVTSVLDPRLKKLSFFKKDSLIFTKGEYPEIEGHDIPDKLVQLESFSSSLAWNPEKKKIAVAYKQTDVIEIYDVEGNVAKRLHGPDYFFPEKQLRNLGSTQKVSAVIGQERDAYFCPVAGKDKLFVLYSGRVYDPEKNDYLMEWLLVFDWNGKPLRRYKLDIPIFRFTINEAANVVYGLTDSEEFRVIKYDLN